MDVTIIQLLTVAIIIVKCCAGMVSPSYLFPANNQPSRDRYNYFDAELLEVLCREGQGNIVISPISIKLVLGMLFDGSGGKTAEEIGAALRIYTPDNQRRVEIQKELYSIHKAQTNPDNFKIANRIFISEKLNLNRDFESHVIANYGTDIAPVSFSQPRRAAEIINKWVSTTTFNKIPKLVNEYSININGKLMIANVIYFKGKWEIPFFAEKTETKCFSTALDQCKKVSFMTDTNYYDFGYVPRLDASAINLPYEGGKFSMILILPHKRHGHIQLSRDMIHVGLDEVLSFMEREKVEVEIPRFTAEFTTDLVKVLEKLHISTVFSNKANITVFSSGDYENVSVTNIFHSAKIEVDEQGTVAAASTGAQFIPLMGESIKYFKADHPFLFFIRDKETGIILFSGKIEEPQRTQEDLNFGQHRVVSAKKDGPAIKSLYLQGNIYNSNSPSALRPNFQPQRYPIQRITGQWNQNGMTFHNFYKR